MDDDEVLERLHDLRVAIRQGANMSDWEVDFVALMLDQGGGYQDLQAAAIEALHQDHVQG